MKSSSTGSLDIVFAVSQHESMTQSRDMPWEYVFELVTSDFEAWDQFDNVRLGVVGFAGADQEYEPYAVLTDNTVNR